MNILFLTLSRFTSINDRGIYPDLVRKFCSEGHKMYVISPMERKFKKSTSLLEQGNLTLLKLKTLNLQQSGVLEKGLAYLMLEFQFIQGIKKYFGDVEFDLILYSTPPINISRVVKFIKHRDDAKSYLLLKDIYPQAAVDDKVFSDKSFIYRYFRKQEKKLYGLSDHIGCMSEANVNYLLKHNPDIPENKIEVNPNSIEPVGMLVTADQKVAFRKKHGIPVNALIFIYGGNLGKSQGIEFYLEVMKMKAEDERVFFITVGAGSAFNQIDRFIKEHSIGNALLFKQVPKDEFDVMVALCDVGLIFLNSYFTVPNFPSRMLSYMEQKKPVLAATDRVTDIGSIITENNFGYWTLHGDATDFHNKIEFLLSKDISLKDLGQNGYDFLLKNYTINQSYNIIANHFSANQR